MKTINFPIRLLLVSLVCAVLLPQGGQAQQLPVYSHYFMNPYLYNPSFAGNGTRNDVFIAHRQQWIGIEDAPVISNLSVHLPTNGRLAFAASVSTDKSILLRNSVVMLTGAYLVPFDTDHYLKFGLSLGLGNNRFDLDAVADQYDPMLANVLEQTNYADASFGVHYYYKGLTLGFSLPRLLRSQAVSTQSFNDVRLEQLKAQFYTASYRWEVVPEMWAIEPVLVWKAGLGAGSQLEGAAVVHFRDLLWLGASWRQEGGAGAMAGVSYRDFLRIGYAYEFATAQRSRFGQGTHEIQLNFRFGKEKKQPFRRAARQQRSGGDAERASGSGKPGVGLDNGFSEAAPAKPRGEGVFTSPPSNKRFTARQGTHPMEMKPSHYVVVASFASEIDALKELHKIKQRVPEAGMGFNSELGLFYIHIYHATEATNADSFYERIVRFPEFRNARIFHIEPKE